MSEPFWISNAVKALDDTAKLQVVGVPFGEDRQGQWFDEGTQIDLEPGEERPVYFFHGFLERAAKAVKRLGRAVYRGIGELAGVRGHLFDVTLDTSHPMAQSVMAAAKAGAARVSSDSTVHLVRPEGIVGKPGRVSAWPVIGLSVMDADTAAQAVNPRAIALAAAKAMLDEEDATPDAAKAGQVFAARNRERIAKIRGLMTDAGGVLSEMEAEFPPAPDTTMTDAAAAGQVVDMAPAPAKSVLDMPRDEIVAMIDARLRAAREMV